LLCGDCHAIEHQRLDRGEPATLLSEAGFGRTASVGMVSEPGRCIRCAASVPFNPDRPLCRECFRVWVAWENPDYQENCCHECGAEAPTSMRKPLCKSCFSGF
jgi:ribosomal protein S14